MKRDLGLAMKGNIDDVIGRKTYKVCAGMLQTDVVNSL